MLHHVFEPSVVIDIGSVWERRTRFLEIYASQVSPGADAEPDRDERRPPSRAMLAARATSFGAMVGVDYGEPFSNVNGRVPAGLAPRSRRSQPAGAPRYQSFSYGHWTPIFDAARPACR